MDSAAVGLCPEYLAGAAPRVVRDDPPGDLECSHGSVSCNPSPNSHMFLLIFCRPLPPAAGGGLKDPEEELSAPVKQLDPPAEAEVAIIFDDPSAESPQSQPQEFKEANGHVVDPGDPQGLRLRRW